MAEGARLESVFTRKGNVGSNPTLSASKSELQRNCPTAFREIRERCPFSASFAPETGLERADCGMNQSRVSRVFSGLARSSPPLKRSQGECLAIINRIIGESDLTLRRSPHRKELLRRVHASNGIAVLIAVQARAHPHTRGYQQRRYIPAFQPGGRREKHAVRQWAMDISETSSGC